MMKRIFLSIAILAATQAMQAADFGYLTIEQLDGTTYSLPSSGLTMVFADGQLTAQSQGQTTTLAQSSLSKMYFTDTDMSGIGETTVGLPVTIRLNDRLMQVAAPAGARVLIASVSGMLVDSFTATGEPSNTSLRPGIYVIRVNDKSTKIHVR